MGSRLAVVTASVITLVGCGGSPNGPAAPPLPVASLSLSGTIFETVIHSAVPFARVDVVFGANLGRTTTADGSGRYRFDTLSPGTMTVRATAPGFLASLDILMLDSDRVLDFSISPAPFQTIGRVVDALSGAPLDGVAISGGIAPAWSDADGHFAAATSFSSTDPLPITLGRSSYVTRNMSMLVPGPAVDVGMIPSSFDLRPFEELCRTPMLRRWTTAPALIVQMRYLRFTNASDPSFEALSAVMTDEEVDQLIVDLSATLARLTGGAFTAFASIHRDTAPLGADVGILNPGAITFARFSGLSAFNPSIAGFGRWLTDEQGVVTGGAMLMDAGSDAREPQRLIIRMHEFGHALGYDHVKTTESIMNPLNAPPPTLFDLQATKLAYQRLPGNTAPDNDPVAGVRTVARTPATWSPPIR
jgi:hypothetical protein